MRKGLGLAATAALFLTLVQPADAAAAKAAPKGPGSISGLWMMQGYISSTHPPRERIAHDETGQIPPLLPWAKDLLEKRITDAEHGKVFTNTAFYCLPEGVPYMLFSAVIGPIQILETPGQVTLISEEFNEVWITHLNEKHRGVNDREAPTFHGESVGHWDGDTLVIDTVNISTRTTLDQVGMPHSDALHVTTRARRLDPATLEFRVTIDDPKTFEHPWTRRVVYKKAPAGERSEDYACDNVRNSATKDGYQKPDFD